MIAVEKAEEFRTCNICYNKKNIHNIVIRYEGTNQGTQVSLCDDCIKDLIQKLNQIVVQNEESMPTIEARKRGRWINHRSDEGHNIADCDQCGETMQWYDPDLKPNYCPNCGADMRGDE